MPTWGLTFQVTDKLLQVTIRPLTDHAKSKFVKNILIGNIQIFIF